MEIIYGIKYILVNVIYFLFFFIFNKDSIGVLVFLFILLISFISLAVVADYLFEFLFEKSSNDPKKDIKSEKEVFFFLCIFL